MGDPEQITYFAETDARNRRIPFGIKAKDRTKHVYVIGKSGMGKSTLLENMAVQDIRNGNGFCFIDPHGQTADKLLEYIPEERKDDVLYFAPFDLEHPVAFNVMEDVGYDKRHLVVSGLMATFKKIWQDAWSARMEYILSNTLLALLEYPDATLLSVNKMYTDKKYREKVVNNIQDISVRNFWTEEFANYTERFAQEATPAIQNKIGQFTTNPLIRNIIGQPKSSFDVRKMMDERKILIMNLSKGLVGEMNANLLGSMFITRIYLSAMSRADVSGEAKDDLPNFYLYVDEFQSFANESFADILSEARKYKLNLTIAHQYIEQMSEEVKAAVFGNVGTTITFRVGAFDADVLEKEFAPVFLAEDIVNLGFVQIYLKLMIDGVGSTPFSARTLPPLSAPESSNVEAVMNASRAKYTKPRAEVEAFIAKLNEPEDGGNSSGKGGGSNKGGGNGSKGGASGGKGGRGGDSRGGYQGGSQNSSRDGGRSGGAPRNDRPPARSAERPAHRSTDRSERPKPSQETKNPFKEAFVAEDFQKSVIDKARESSDNPSQKEVSLNELKKPSGSRPAQNDRNFKKSPQAKGPTPENSNQLKSALQGILSKTQETKSGSDTSSAPTPAPKPKPVQNKPPVVEQGQQNVREVPENELRKVLDVNK